MTVGEYFGELALLYSATRSASVKVEKDCLFWCLSRKSFKTTIENMVKKNYKLAKKYVENITTFNFLSKKQKNVIAYNMHSLKYEKNTTIFK